MEHRWVRRQIILRQTPCLLTHLGAAKEPIHPVDVISHNQSGNCAEKGFKQKSVDKMLSMYYFEVSIGFKMALRVDIAQ